MNPKFHQYCSQKGVSLVIVLLLMMLSSLLVLGGSRVANLNEYLAGNDSDAQRALEAAQIMLRDAELDIQDDRRCGAGQPCNQRIQPLSKTDNELLLNLIDAALAASPITCANAVCVNQGVRVSGDPSTSFWNDPTQLSNFTSGNRGATYGQWTRANPGAAAASANPIVSATNPARAWYWIELLPFSGQAAPWAQDCAPTAGSGKYFFRITAVALGRTGSPTVVQEIFVPRPAGEGRRCPI